MLEINPKELKLLEINARYMKHEEFNRLVQNIKKDGKLTSTPFCCRDGDGKYLVLSGNHRVMAAIEAKLEKIICLATNDVLTEEQKIAIQLSHNAIAGQDDMATLKQLYEKIFDVDMKEYTGLDDKTLQILEKFTTDSLPSLNLEYALLNILFLPNEFKRAQVVFEKALNEAKKADSIWLAKMKDYDRWLNAQEIAGASYGVKNLATAFDIILTIFEKNMAQLSDGYDEVNEKSAHVYIESLIGRNTIPIDTAKKLKKIMDIMIGKKEISSGNLWKLFDKLADYYLS